MVTIIATVGEPAQCIMVSFFHQNVVHYIYINLQM